MGVLDTLSRLLDSEDAAMSREAAAALVQSYSDCVGRAAQLERHAKLAPQAWSAHALTRLAAEDTEQGSFLRHAIDIAGITLPPSVTDARERDGLNHWARLVDDLEAHRRC